MMRDTGWVHSLSVNFDCDSLSEECDERSALWKAYYLIYSTRTLELKWPELAKAGRGPDTPRALALFLLHNLDSSAE